MNNKQKTIFLDIDGTLFQHKGTLDLMMTEEPIVLDGVVEQLVKWRREGHYIVLTTARAEGTRSVTESQLLNNGVFFDQLIMGLTNGCRILINDVKPDGMKTASAYSIARDGGISHIDIYEDDR